MLCPRTKAYEAKLIFINWLLIIETFADDAKVAIEQNEENHCIIKMDLVILKISYSPSSIK